MVRACKWVDEVAFDVPYSPTIAMLDEHHCDFCIHGDDISVSADGVPTHSALEGRFRIIKRTEGTSTTDLVNRIFNAAAAAPLSSEPMQAGDYAPISEMLASSKRYRDFSSGFCVFPCGSRSANRRIPSTRSTRDLSRWSI
jgi:glycerol-3-phosphate cytidylyltransferase-like family protein